MDYSIHGSIYPWIHGSMDPWIQGPMDPWILTKSHKNPPILSKDIKNTDIRLPELPTVVYLWTDDSLMRGASPRPVFSAHRKSLGRRYYRAGSAQWLGPRMGGGRNRAVPGSIPPSRGLLFFRKHRGKVKFWGHIGLGLGWFGGRFGDIWGNFDVISV